jgi:hypothetical protein
LVDWAFAPASPAAFALVATAETKALEAEARGRKRGEAETAAFRKALGAILGAALTAWSRDVPQPVAQSLKAKAFTGLPGMGARTCKAALKALTAAGLLHHHPGFRREVMPGCFGNGRSSRWWPSQALLDLAASHGLTPDCQGAFRRHGAEACRAAKVPAPIIIKPLAWRGAHGAWEVFGPVKSALPQMAAARRTVDELNSRVAASVQTGCPLPVFHRGYVGGLGGQGRFYAHASGTASYQQMPEAERLGSLTINGEPVAEVDARASQLTILHGCLGLPPPEGDPYAVPGIPRGAVKAFITGTLGAGKPKQRWSQDQARQARAEGWPAIAIVREAVLRRFPCLENPAAAVPPGFLPEVPRTVALPHYLAGLEAEALALAMRQLWSQSGVLALPMHDGLIVPRSAADAAAEALRFGYLIYAGEEPRVEIAWWENGRRVSREVAASHPD